MKGRFRWPVRSDPEAVGNFVGYASANERMRRALIQSGWVQDDDAGDVAVHLCFPLAFRPIPDTKTVLFTMYENPNDEVGLRAVFKPALDRADLVLVPSQFCADMFRPLTKTPIEICPLGVDSEMYEYRRRRWAGPSEPFVWLYLGAPNYRKIAGLSAIWHGVINPLPWSWLYMKVTGLDMLSDIDAAISTSRFRRISDKWGDRLLAVDERVIVDNRKLPESEIARMYRGAHAMLLLHLGEGWGQTALEAMSSGTPLIVSDYGGTQEFADSRTAWLVRTEHRRVELSPDPDCPGAPGYYEGQWPMPDHAVEQASLLMGDYRRASRIAATGAARARSLSWRAAGERLSEILRRAGFG